METSPVKAVISRKYQVLTFVKQHYLECGESPTLGEIAIRFNISRQRADAIVRALERDQLVKRARGRRRGIMLAGGAKMVSSIDALLQLKDDGWKINAADSELAPPLSNLRLPPLPVLGYPDDRGSGDGDGQQSG